MRIAIIGAGYVGLVSGACFAEFGHVVTCLDTDLSKVESLTSGVCPIYEPGLDDLLKSNLRRERLFFTTADWKATVSAADVVFIAVGTPTSRRGGGYADLSYVYEAARSLAPHMSGYTLVVNKSTVPVGTARQVKRIIGEANPAATFDVAANPEFLREGEALHDFMCPDRVVLGVSSAVAQELLEQVYRPLRLKKTPFVVTSPETAELTKYAANALLATKISFINEMANLCEVVNADIQDLAKGLGLDQRIGSRCLHPGPGFGGSCFPKDTVALIRLAQEHGAPSRITETVVEVNHAQKARMVRKIRDALGGDENGKTLAILGLTFKPGTDDMRDAPALTILPPLIERGLRVQAHDPVGMSEARKVLPGVEYCEDPYTACDGADGVCLLTEWNPYRALDLARLKQLLKRPLFIDLRNVYQPHVMKEAGFCYISVGRGAVDGSC